MTFNHGVEGSSPLRAHQTKSSTYAKSQDLRNPSCLHFRPIPDRRRTAPLWGKPPVSYGLQAVSVPVDRRQRTCELCRCSTAKRWKHMVCYANVPPGTNRGGSALNLPFLCVAATN